MEGDSINADELIKRMSPPRWDDNSFDCDFRRGAEGVAIAVGFYEFEEFGVWSRVSKPYLIIDRMLSGEFVLTVEARAFGKNIGRELAITIGDCTRPIVLDETPTVLGLLFDVHAESNVIKFDGVTALSDPANDDPRSLGIGLTILNFRRLVKQDRVAPGESMVIGIQGDAANDILVGFHPAESWGAWTAQGDAWIVVPPLQPGTVGVEVEYRSHSANEDSLVRVDCGGSTVYLPTGDRWERQIFELRPTIESQVIHLAGLRCTQLMDSEDPRALGIGVRHLALTQIGMSDTRSLTTDPDATTDVVPDVREMTQVSVEVPKKSFVVAIDGEANDESNSDIISAFVYAHRHHANALLFVISPESTISNVFSDVLYLLSRVGSYACRVIVIPRGNGEFIPKEILRVSRVFVLAATANPSAEDMADAMSRRRIMLGPENLLPVGARKRKRTVAIPVTLRPYRVPGERFGYRRNLVQVVEWDDLVRGMASAGNLAGGRQR